MDMKFETLRAPKEETLNGGFSTSKRSEDNKMIPDLKSTLDQKSMLDTERSNKDNETRPHIYNMGSIDQRIE